jgi:hypothetical protein
MFLQIWSTIFGCLCIGALCVQKRWAGVCVTPPLLFYTLAYIDKYSSVLIRECPSRLCYFDVTAIELGLIQTLIAQKPILRIEVRKDQVKRQ